MSTPATHQSMTPMDAKTEASTTAPHTTFSRRPVVTTLTSVR